MAAREGLGPNRATTRLLGECGGPATPCLPLPHIRGSCPLDSDIAPAPIRDGKRWLWVAGSGAALALIAGLTLTPTAAPEVHVFQTCLACGAYGVSDDIANVALFVPLGVCLYLAGLPGRRTIALAFVLSGAIELAQLAIPGRESSVADVLTNPSGAAAGVALAYWLPRRRRTVRSTLLGAAGVLGLLAAIGFAFQPSLPDRPYYAVWNPEPPNVGRSPGRVLSADVGGLPLAAGRVSEPGAVRQGILSGRTLHVRMVAEHPTAGTTPRVNIYDIRHQELVELGEDKHPGRRGDILLHVRLRATDLRLRQPDLRWVGALAAVKAGDTLEMGFRRAPHAYCISFGDRERCDFTNTVGRAWAMLQFVPHTPATTEAALSALLMGLIGICFGLFVRRDAAGYVVVGIVLAGAVVVPALLGLALTPAIQVAGLAAGVAAGLFVP